MEQSNSNSNTNKNKSLIAVLKRLRSTANFENAAFPNIKIGDHFEARFPSRVKSDDITDGIREATRIYRDSWVTPIIDDLILWAEGKKDIKQIRHRL